ncbi:Enoyl-CoA hydratase/carnithine racemase [Devosia sp. YR412]|uniref:enoyl-CoA hydratase/isomerase family protein n=1 Tax=Devosia sp. YR412 TaxID=1881030 RepID=UPI0008B8321F|nr:enoyl-CoA hydratase/isomerase family protein [Devosia sp. YR412]SEP63911.1 Enoyl-CoA hydratase/carnithine racemase [Devosia sp. YR412]
MTAPYQTIHVNIQGGIARVTIDNAPVNVLSLQMMTELTGFLDTVKDDTAVKVVIFDSANPEFFIAHVDMTMAEDAKIFEKLGAITLPGLNPFQSLSERLRRLPQVTIVKLEGMARGGGAEFVAAADMSFGAIGKAALSQVEALMGIVPGGAGTQYLRHRVGRNRAMEIVLGVDLFDAKTAERYGWINRAVPADEIDAFVDTLAQNIANLADGVIAAAKLSLPAEDYSAGLEIENTAWAGLFAQPAAGRLLVGGLENGAQTPVVERNIEAMLRELAAQRP